MDQIEREERIPRGEEALTCNQREYTESAAGRHHQSADIHWSFCWRR
jgi:hypothetical protein